MWEPPDNMGSTIRTYSPSLAKISIVCSNASILGKQHTEWTIYPSIEMILKAEHGGHWRKWRGNNDEDGKEYENMNWTVLHLHNSSLWLVL